MLGLSETLSTIVANTRDNDIKMIKIEELYDSKNNFFEINNVEELAESIMAQGGVKENLIVCPRPEGGYEIISGHRRKAAVQYLIDKGETTVPHKLPCLIQTYSDDNDKSIDLIMMNLTQRDLSDGEKLKSYEKLDAILKEKKALGEKFGNLRVKISEMLQISTGQVSKLENIKKHAIPEVKDAVMNGDITIHTANEIACLDKNAQKEIIEDKSEPVTPKKVMEKVKTKKTGKKKNAINGKKNKTSEITEDNSIKEQFKHTLSRYFGNDKTAFIDDCCEDLMAIINKELLRDNK